MTTAVQAPSFSTAADGAGALSGALVFATAAAALTQGRERVRAGMRVLDLKGVSSADSAGLAVLLALGREAQRRKAPLTYANPPASLRALARLSDVDGLLGFTA